MPTLRERTHDIIPMANQFAKRFFASRGKVFNGFTAESQAALQGYRWPGNVRELVNVMERAALVARKDTEKMDICSFLGAEPASKITVLPEPQQSEAIVSEGPRLTLVKSSSSSPVLQLQDVMESYTALKKRWSFSFEREYLVAILNRHDGNVSAAAREAHLDRSNFLRLLRRHRMTARDFRKNGSADLLEEGQKKAA